jgi:hypothetical protein
MIAFFRPPVPTLRGRLRVSAGRGEPCLLVVIWCPHCRCEHSHGWPDPGEELSHRLCHCCKRGSPFEAGGYFIAVNLRSEYNALAVAEFHARTAAWQKRRAAAVASARPRME